MIVLDKTFVLDGIHRDMLMPEPWADDAWPDEGDPIPCWTGEPRRCIECGGPVNKYNDPLNPAPTCHPCAAERSRQDRPILVDDIVERLIAGPLAVNRHYAPLGFTKLECNNAVRQVRRRFAREGGPRIEHVGNGIYRAVDRSQTTI